MGEQRARARDGRGRGRSGLRGDYRERIGERSAADQLGRRAGPLLQHHDFHGLAGAVLGIGVRRQFKVQRQHAAFGCLGPGAARRVDAIGRDGSAAAAWRKAHERGPKVAKGSEGFGVAADAARERGIDENGRGPDVWCEEIVNQLAIVARHSDAREGGCEHLGADRINLVEDEAGTGAVREGGEQAGAGRWFKDQIRGRDCASERSEVGDPGGGRELLKLDLLLAADGMRRKAGDQLGQRGEAIARGGRQVRLREVHDLGEFEHVVGVAK